MFINQTPRSDKRRSSSVFRLCVGRVGGIEAAFGFINLVIALIFASGSLGARHFPEGPGCRSNSSPVTNLDWRRRRGTPVHTLRRAASGCRWFAGNRSPLLSAAMTSGVRSGVGLLILFVRPFVRDCRYRICGRAFDGESQIY